MRLLGYFALAFVTLGLAAAVAKVALVMVLCLMAFAIVFNPRETVGALASLAFIGLLGRYPVPMIGLSVALAVFAIMESRTR